MKKRLILAASISLALMGCNSDGGSTASQTQTSGSFVDAPIAGMAYTTSSGKSGFTDSEGNYSAPKGDTITFYLGGKENGLKIGAASGRDVLTPFEATGSYQRAVNLAVILQSLNTGSSEDIITIPAALKNITSGSDEAIALSKLSLDDKSSIHYFLTSVDAPREVQAEEAVKNMNATFGDDKMARGSKDANPFRKTDGSIVHYIDVMQSEQLNNYTYVHADKLLPEAVFNETRGMPHTSFKLDKKNVTELVGSNNTSLSGGSAVDLLTKLDGEHNHILSGSFQYSLLDPETAIKTEDQQTQMTWAEAEKHMPFQAKTIQELNHYTVGKIYNDADEGEDASWQKETTSGSYDPITGIYTEIAEKTELSGNNCDTESCTAKRVEDHTAFYYETKDDTPRYVDFKGTWEDKQMCSDGELAKSTLVFDDKGVTMSGQECYNGTPTDLDQEPDPVASATYEQLADMDFWWFNNQEDKGQSSSQATLTELNSVARFCDVDGYTPGDKCIDSDGNNKTYYVKFEYHPAGTNWDRGLLTRTKMHVENEEAVTDVRDTMQKVG
ncbi:hypothetical protein L4C34_12500 [Vibrio profundum]|uniref:hypothetical protein n=1 Tax=Vibrio profundum TaxID=2910247 RepID=UPI003D0EE574